MHKVKLNIVSSIELRKDKRHTTRLAIIRTMSTVSTHWTLRTGERTCFSAGMTSFFGPLCRSQLYACSMVVLGGTLSSKHELLRPQYSLPFFVISTGSLIHVKIVLGLSCKSYIHTFEHNTLTQSLLSAATPAKNQRKTFSCLLNRACRATVSNSCNFPSEQGIHQYQSLQSNPCTVQTVIGTKILLHTAKNVHLDYQHCSDCYCTLWKATQCE